MFSGVGDGSHALLVLGFESADHPLQAWMARALELVREHGGQFDADAVARSMAPEGGDSHRTGAAGAWRAPGSSLRVSAGATLHCAAPIRPPPEP